MTDFGVSKEELDAILDKVKEYENKSDDELQQEIQRYVSLAGQFSDQAKEALERAGAASARQAAMSVMAGYLLRMRHEREAKR